MIDAPADGIDLILAASAANPDKIAIRAGSLQVPYAALEQRIRAYAAAFARIADPVVLIALPRGLDAYAAVLGAGLAGGFYTTVNDASPPEKLNRVARQLRPNIVVAPPDLAAVLATGAPDACVIDPARLDTNAILTGRGHRHDIAYIIFTSGSTGEPKGVVVPRTALNHYVAWIHSSGTVKPDDVVSQFNNLAFDVSVLDIFGAFGAGATLVPIGGRGDRLMPARAIAREGITVWISVPSAIDLMRTAQQLTHANLQQVRLFTLAGEPLLRDQIEAIFAACPEAKIRNAYGPTEATVTVTQMEVSSKAYEHACRGSAVSIGLATPGMTLHLAEGAHPDEGEIVIIGPQLAVGYWNDPERTALAFRPVRVGGDTVRGYFTGDWAERRNGLLFFRERTDLQVKIRGYRIELDEVAAAIRACGWPCVCVFKRGETLAALVETSAGQTLDATALQAMLANRIEAYAIPAHIEAVPMIPRNENDKIDRVLAAELLDARLAAAESLGER